MAELTFHERQHLQKLIQQEASVKYIFDEFVRNVGVHMKSWTDTGLKNIWKRNKNVERAIEREMEALHDKLVANISEYTIDAWNRSNDSTDDIVSKYISGMSISDVAKRGMYARNEEVLKTFMNRKVDGLTLSERVWNITGNAKQNIEFYLESGLSVGRPSAKISQDIRQLLKDPDKRFRRIRNKEGKLVYSAPMADYHPGRGVYRSSARNAMRMAVTTTNEMYRIADSYRWNNLDFVVGIIVKRSPSYRDACPICDAMKGTYPKNFVFKGWHPWCICFAIPKLQSKSDFIDSLTGDNDSKPEYVTGVPSGALKYVNEQIKKGNLSPDSYMIKENWRFFGKS